MYVLALALALSLKPVVNNGNPPVRKQTATKQPAESPTPLDTEGIAAPSTDQGQTKTGEHHDPSNDARYAVDIKQQPTPEDTPLFKWYLLATGAGVAVNAFIWFAILGQTKLNRSIAKGADKSASAAEKSANALIDIQRAWIDAEVIWNMPRDPLYTFMGHDKETHTLIDVSLSAVNYGSTPGWIYERHIKFDITNSIAPKPDLAGADTSYQIHPLSKEQKPIAWRLNKLTCRGQIIPSKHAFVYGVVKYRDIFNKDRETWFGFMIGKDGFERIAHPEYNKST